jgi:TRAP-type C4-dicarboxylate transport system permease small subunit
VIRFENSVNKIWLVLARISSVFLVAEMLFIVVNIIMRSMFKTPVIGSTEIVKYVSLTGAAFAVSHNEWMDGNIRVTMLLEIVSRKAEDIISFIAYALLSGSLVYVTYILFRQFIKFHTNGDVTTELNMPSWIFAGILAFGFATLTLCCFSKTIIRGYYLFKGIDFENHLDCKGPGDISGEPVKTL